MHPEIPPDRDGTSIVDHQYVGSIDQVDALTWAGDDGLRTIAITGFDGGAAGTVAEVAICG
jgi:hypothetical protein